MLQFLVDALQIYQSSVLKNQNIDSQNMSQKKKKKNPW